MKTITSNARAIGVALFLVLGCGMLIAGATAAPSASLTNVAISDAVEDELRRDNAFSSDWIDVASHDGVITLTGLVDDLLSKKRAGRIAETVKGVSAVVNRIKVNPPETRSDLDIKFDVQDALLTDPATESYQIDVTVKDNRVTLSGTVNSWQERKLCEKVAMGVKGVTHITNDIVFQYDRKRTDHDIRQDIEQQLRWDVLVDHAQIKVNVKDGNVRLGGTVGSLAEKRRAISDAYVSGVQSVHAEKLDVRYWSRNRTLRGEKYKNTSDEKISKAVENALFYDPRVVSAKITLDVDNGVVTLRGTVDNLKAKRAAGMDARNTVGVIEVKNRLKVRPSEAYSDDILEDRIERTLTRVPSLKSDDIAVEVQNGIADLIGSVDTFFQKAQVEDLAARTRGVIAVDNYLVVKKGHDPYPYDPYLDDWYLKDFAYDYRPQYPPRNRTDQEIKNRIESQLFWSPFIDSEEVSIEMNNGMAVLSGTVDTRTEFNAAVKNAYDGGAVAVKNELKVR